MPKPFSTEFRREVIAVARQGDQSIAQVARSFGVSESCLSRWLRITDREDGISTDNSAPAQARTDSDLEAENRRPTRISTMGTAVNCRFIGVDPCSQDLGPRRTPLRSQ